MKIGRYDPNLFQFYFKPPPGWLKIELPAAQGRTLAEAREAYPAVADLQLTEVWFACNRVWHDRMQTPWEDPVTEGA